MNVFYLSEAIRGSTHGLSEILSKMLEEYVNVPLPYILSARKIRGQVFRFRFFILAEDSPKDDLQRLPAFYRWLGSATKTLRTLHRWLPQVTDSKDPRQPVLY